MRESDPFYVLTRASDGGTIDDATFDAIKHRIASRELIGVHLGKLLYLPAATTNRLEAEGEEIRRHAQLSYVERPETPQQREARLAEERQLKARVAAGDVWVIVHRRPVGCPGLDDSQYFSLYARIAGGELDGKIDSRGSLWFRPSAMKRLQEEADQETRARYRELERVSMLLAQAWHPQRTPEDMLEQRNAVVANMASRLPPRPPNPPDPAAETRHAAERARIEDLLSSATFGFKTDEQAARERARVLEMTDALHAQARGGKS